MRKNTNCNFSYSLGAFKDICLNLSSYDSNRTSLREFLDFLLINHLNGSHLMSDDEWECFCREHLTREEFEKASLSRDLNLLDENSPYFDEYLERESFLEDVDDMFTLFVLYRRIYSYEEIIHCYIVCDEKMFSINLKSFFEHLGNRLRRLIEKDIAYKIDVFDFE